MTYVAFRDTPPTLLDLAGGRIHAVVGPLGATLPLARDGPIRMLAIPGHSKGHELAHGSGPTHRARRTVPARGSAGRGAACRPFLGAAGPGRSCPAPALGSAA
jgi:hypothetical protein